MLPQIQCQYQEINVFFLKNTKSPDTFVLFTYFIALCVPVLVVNVLLTIISVLNEAMNKNILF